MSNDFIAIDVETANTSRASICQIGLVGMSGSDELWRWSSWVNLEEEFEQKFCGIHGIHPEKVRDAPLFPEVLNAIRPSIQGQVLVSWTDFDQYALCYAADKYRLRRPSCSWLDACQIARHVWPELPSHNLQAVAETLQLRFQHHDALADAWACGRAFAAVLGTSKVSIADWMHKFGAPESPPYEGPSEVLHPVEVTREGRADLPLSGDTVLFTGDFELGKSRLGELAWELGCSVKNNFSKHVTILVVGARDAEKYGGDTKSGKLRTAEAAIKSGQRISILREDEFLK